MKKILFFLFLLFCSSKSYSNFYYDVYKGGPIYDYSTSKEFFCSYNGYETKFVNNQCYYRTSPTDGWYFYQIGTVVCHNPDVHVIDKSGVNWMCATSCPAGTLPDPIYGACDTPIQCPDGSTVPPGTQCTSKKITGKTPCTNTLNPTQDNMVGNPCDASTGNKFQTEVDYSSNTLNFVRYYNSLHASESVLGKQWSHHYLSSLTIGTTIQVNRYDGKVLEFNNDTGNWISDADIIETLTQVGSLWELKDPHKFKPLFRDTSHLGSIV